MLADVVVCGWRRASGGTAVVALPPRAERRSVRAAPGCAAVVGVVDELVVEVVEVLVVVDVVRWVVVDPRVVVEVEVVVGVVVEVDVVVEAGAVEVGVVGAGAVEVVRAGAVDVGAVVAVEVTPFTVAVAAEPRLVLDGAPAGGAHAPLIVADPRLTEPGATNPPLTSAESRLDGLVSPLGTDTPEYVAACPVERSRTVTVQEPAEAADTEGRASAAAALIPTARARTCWCITA